MTVTEVMVAYFPTKLPMDARSAAPTRFGQSKEQCLEQYRAKRAVSYGWGVEDDIPMRDGMKEEKASVLMVFIGWDSIESYAEAQKNEGYQPNMRPLKNVEGMMKLQTMRIGWRRMG